MLPLDHDTASMSRDGVKSGRRLVVVVVALAAFILMAMANFDDAVDDAPHGGGRVVAAVTAAPLPDEVDTTVGQRPVGDVSTLCRNAIRAGAVRVLVENAGWNKRPPTETDAPAVADDANAPPVPPHEASAPVLYFGTDSFSLEEQLPSGEAATIRQVCNDPMALQGLHVSFKRFSRDDAFQCLAGRNILFYGNSNTRTLYTALEALLRGTRQIGRVAAKQRCDNSKKNHSCAATVTLEGHAPVELFYWGYVKDIYHPSMAVKMVKSGQMGRADIVLGNAGANVIQGTPDGVWEKVYDDPTVTSKLTDFVASVKPGGQFWWHTTTRLCDQQSHFTRYKYDPKYWSGRSLVAMNNAVTKSNYLASRAFATVNRGLVERRAAIAGYLDGNLLVAEGSKATTGLPGGVCGHFDDPLHHRFLDRELVQLLLNGWCYDASKK